MLTPLGWIGSFLLFGASSALFAVFLFVIMPSAAAHTSPFWAFHVGFTTPLAVILVSWRRDLVSGPVMFVGLVFG